MLIHLWLFFTVYGCFSATRSELSSCHAYRHILYISCLLFFFFMLVLIFKYVLLIGYSMIILSLPRKRLVTLSFHSYFPESLTSLWDFYIFVIMGNSCGENRGCGGWGTEVNRKH